MSRTTEAAVKIIVEVDEDLYPDISSFLDDAHTLYDAVVGDANTEAIAEIVERYLSAHLFSTAKERTVKSEGVKGITQTFSVVTDMGLDFTPYGQTAKRFDVSGKLAAWDLRAAGKSTTLGVTPGILWLGTDPDDITSEDFDDGSEVA